MYGSGVSVLGDFRSPVVGLVYYPLLEPTFFSKRGQQVRSADNPSCAVMCAEAAQASHGAHDCVALHRLFMAATDTSPDAS